MLFSSTSWTEDEDFGLLIDAALRLEEQLSVDADLAASFPRVVIVVTGKGVQIMVVYTFHFTRWYFNYLRCATLYPLSTRWRFACACRVIFVLSAGPLKAAFEARVAELSVRRLLGRRIVLRTAWLEPGQYPTLLGSADLGVCLHASSSGLDLPMKVAGMIRIDCLVLAF